MLVRESGSAAYLFGVEAAPVASNRGYDNFGSGRPLTHRQWFSVHDGSI